MCIHIHTPTPTRTPTHPRSHRDTHRQVHTHINLEEAGEGAGVQKLYASKETYFRGKRDLLRSKRNLEEVGEGAKETC